MGDILSDIPAAVLVSGIAMVVIIIEGDIIRRLVWVPGLVVLALFVWSGCGKCGRPQLPTVRGKKSRGPASPDRHGHLARFVLITRGTTPTRSRNPVPSIVFHRTQIGGI